ncbi:hypothetical protein J1N35_037413 [Gossypium stocksii]|uniref:Zinc knuckle CX2CX4HX4C domain-containing protein n=1 Tax=Gossypium stocksii TaxID=47602 RepID=A0A9D3UKQ1_9ROSI|nr:hypothetical protein J1N35_037413 [Gossypium stocksii]
MEEGMANLRLMDEEEEEFNEEATMVQWNYQHCLVGRCLTDSVVHFPSLCNTMADLWHPIGGICISDLGDKRKFIRVRVYLDVTLTLKRKKNIRIGTATTIYARFQYENLGLFYFICGKLRHGESFCPMRLRLDSSKIIFGWDISLRVAARRRNNTTSRWLRTADGSVCSSTDLERNDLHNNLSKENVNGRNSMCELGTGDLISKSMILEPGQQPPVN